MPACSHCSDFLIRCSKLCMLFFYSWGGFPPPCNVAMGHLLACVRESVVVLWHEGSPRTYFPSEVMLLTSSFLEDSDSYSNNEEMQCQRQKAGSLVQYKIWILISLFWALITKWQCSNFSVCDLLCGIVCSDHDIYMKLYMYNFIVFEVHFKSLVSGFSCTLCFWHLLNTLHLSDIFYGFFWWGGWIWLTVTHQSQHVSIFIYIELPFICYTVFLLSRMHY